MSKSLVGVLVLGCSLITHSCFSAPEPVQLSTNRTPLFSSSRMFHVSGGESVENLQVATFADKILKAISEDFGGLPGRFNAPVKIVLLDRDSSPRVDRVQGYRDQTLTQVIRLSGVNEIDQELVLEVVTWCLLNRYALEYQPEQVREVSPVEMPQWVSMGVGQCLFSLTQNRNKQLLQQKLSSPFHFVSRPYHVLERAPCKSSPSFLRNVGCKFYG